MSDFLDSNVILYLTQDDVVKAERAETLLSGGGWISVQVLNEVAHVIRRKHGFDWSETRAFLEAVRTLVDVIALTETMQREGMRVADRYQFSVYDGMIVAAALAAGCETLWSEDMHDGLVIDGRLTVSNPFR